MKEGCCGWGTSLCEVFHEGGFEGGLLYLGTRNMRFLRDIEMPCKWASVSIGAILGNMEGVRLTVLLSVMRSIFGLIPWTRRSLRF